MYEYFFLLLKCLWFVVSEFCKNIQIHFGNIFGIDQSNSKWCGSLYFDCICIHLRTNPLKLIYFETCDYVIQNKNKWLRQSISLFLTNRHSLACPLLFYSVLILSSFHQREENTFAVTLQSSFLLLLLQTMIQKRKKEKTKWPADSFVSTNDIARRMIWYESHTNIVRNTNGKHMPLSFYCELSMWQ